MGWISQLGFFFLIGAIAMFFWGLVKFISSAGNEADREKGKQFILWGILAFVVIVSTWGLVWFLQQSTGVGPGNPIYRDKTGAPV